MQARRHSRRGAAHCLRMCNERARWEKNGPARCQLTLSLCTLAFTCTGFRRNLSSGPFLGRPRWEVSSTYGTKGGAAQGRAGASQQSSAPGRAVALARPAAAAAHKSKPRI